MKSLEVFRKCYRGRISGGWNNLQPEVLHEECQCFQITEKGYVWIITVMYGCEIVYIYIQKRKSFDKVCDRLLPRNVNILRVLTLRLHF